MSLHRDLIRGASRRRRLPFYCSIAALALGAACGRGGSAPPGAGAFPPASVKLLTLQAKPIERTSEFIGSLRSLRSTTIQPEVAGSIRRIFVKSGDRVQPGTPLVQIDPDKQQATVQTSEASRSGIEADVQFWRQQVKRLESLVSAGAISQQELEQAQNTLKNAEARLAALNAQVNREQVELRYYRVVSPQKGVVGDIPVREGDRVTESTVITTVDDNSALEVYLQVPLERAPELRVGLPVQLLDADGKVAAVNPVSFIAPRVDESTQSVLAKSLLRSAPAQLRSQQFVRSRIIWNTAEGITVPVVAVSRISGQYFVFLAEPQGSGFVARQRAIQVGEVLGDDYVAAGGLKAGDRIVVSGIQKLADGAPIKPE
jgi:RND family efflux transporter MFP subunit